MANSGDPLARRPAPGEPTPPAPAGRLEDGVACAFCASKNTRLLSPFGGQLSVAQYWCDACRTGFEYLKWG